MKIDRRTLFAGMALCCTLLVAPRAAAQEVTSTSRTSTRAADTVSDEVDAQDMDAVRRLLQDENRHRDRLARIRRLRELAQEGNQRERLAQLDDLERRELQKHEARRIRAQAGMSDDSRRTADRIRDRGGKTHLRRRLASASEDASRRGQAGPQRPGSPTRSTTSSRPAPRPPARPVSRPPTRPSSGRSPR